MLRNKLLLINAEVTPDAIRIRYCMREGTH
jgi:hypothetical protein